MIEFTQYLLPDGRQKRTYIECNPEVESKAEDISSAGFNFEVEVLTTGDVSITIAGYNIDVAQRLCANGPGIREAVEDMILKFDIEEGRKLDDES